MKWSIEKANKWHKEKGWLLGFNYVPSSAVNSTEMWQAITYDRETIKCELKLAARTGFNSCRVFLQYLVWENERERFIETLSDFCGIAETYGLSVMPILFDDCAFSGLQPYLGPQNPPRHGVHNSGWTPSPGSLIADDPSKEPSLCEYVKSVIGAFKDDNRIVIWDLYNEPGNNNRGSIGLTLLDKAFGWAREIDPSQPLTVGAWIDEDYNIRFAELSDVLSFHDYRPIEESRGLIKKLKQYNRPIYCTEWLCRQNGNTFESHLPLYTSEIAGAYNWGMFLGKTQTNLCGSTIFGEPDANPELWQHDLFYTDGRPYRQEEITFIENFAAEKIKTKKDGSI